MKLYEPDEKLIKKTIEIWSKEYGYKISREDAFEIIHNLREFAEVLVDIDLSDRNKQE